jgi:hypothetical protein
MKPISLAVLVAILAAGLTAGCAATGTTTSTGAMVGSPTQANQGALGLKAEDDPANSAGNPFRIAALVLYPIGLILQRAFEAPYVGAAAINPEWFGINETEQEYLEQRWGYRQAIRAAVESRGVDGQPAPQERK